MHGLPDHLNAENFLHTQFKNFLKITSRTGIFFKAAKAALSAGCSNAADVRRGNFFLDVAVVI